MAASLPWGRIIQIEAPVPSGDRFEIPERQLVMLGMIAALLLAAGPLLGDFPHSPDPDIHPLAKLPSDVRVHIDRTMNCNHWTSELPYEADRRRQMKAALRQLNCAILGQEERRLRHRYANSPAILRAIEDNRDITGD